MIFIKKLHSIILPLLTLIFLSGCISIWNEEKRNFETFVDIPIPEESVMDKKKTAIIGESKNWWGVLEFSITNTVPVLFDYYKKEMRRFGWKEITFLKGETTNYSLVFSRNNRIAQIGFNFHPIEGTQIKIVMSQKTN